MSQPDGFPKAFGKMPAESSPAGAAVEENASEIKTRKEKTASRNSLPDGLNPFPPFAEKTVMESITTSSGLSGINVTAFYSPPSRLTDALSQPLVESYALAKFLHRYQTIDAVAGINLPLRQMREHKQKR